MVPEVVVRTPLIGRCRSDLSEKEPCDHGTDRGRVDQNLLHLTAPYTLAPNVAGATTVPKMLSAFCNGSDGELAT